MTNYVYNFQLILSITIILIILDFLELLSFQIYINFKMYLKLHNIIFKTDQYYITFTFILK